MDKDAAGRQAYSLCHVTISMDGHQPCQVPRVKDILRRLFVLDKARPGDSTHSLHLDFKASGNPSGRPVDEGNASPLVVVEVLKKGDGFTIRCGESVLDLDLRRDTGVAVLDEEFWTLSPQLQLDFFVPYFVMLLRGRGIYALHADGVVNEGTGYLIVGSSGHGKTTLAMALVGEGWSYLSDGLIMLRGTQERVIALAFGRRFSFGLVLATHFPELGSLGREHDPCGGRKALVDIEPLYPHGFTPRCDPRILIFPEIVERHQSELIPMDKTGAMISLVRESPVDTTDRAGLSKQLDVLKALASQATSYRLLAGMDVLQDPAAVAHLLSQVGNV